MSASRITLRSLTAVVAGAALALTTFAGAQASVGPGIPGPSATNAAGIGPAQVWDYYNDFVASATGSNPSPGGVWSYRVGTLGAPQSSTLLPAYQVGLPPSAAIASWYNTGFPIQQPRVSVNTGSVPAVVPGDCGTITIPKTKGFAHPYDSTHAAIIAWRSPVTRTINVHMTLKLAESPNCGNGIAWEVWKNGTQLPGESGVVTGSHGSQFYVPVVPGDTLYLVIDSLNGNYTSDDTIVSWKLH